MRMKNIKGEKSHLFAYLRFCAFVAFCAYCACKIFFYIKKKSLKLP